MLYISLNQKPFNLNGKDFSFKREFFLQKYYCSVRPPSSPALRSIFCSNLGQWQNLFIWLCPFIKPILDIYIYHPLTWYHGQGLLWLPKSRSQKNHQVPVLKVRSQLKIFTRSHFFRTETVDDCMYHYKFHVQFRKKYVSANGPTSRYFVQHVGNE